MPDTTPAGQPTPTRPPRRTAAYQALEARADEQYAELVVAGRDLADARRQLRAEHAAHQRTRAHLRRAEILLGRTIAALSQWRTDDGNLASPAADALVATLGNVLSLPADQRPNAEPDEWEPIGFPEHPDDDEPPVEP